MQQLLANTQTRLEREGNCQPKSIAIGFQNDSRLVIGDDQRSSLINALMDALDSTAVIIAHPHDNADTLAVRSTHSKELIPKDSESLSSLHSIPIIRHDQGGTTKTIHDTCIQALTNRKACIVEGIGLVAHASLTLEQAAIYWSSLYHATSIHLLSSYLTNPKSLSYEQRLFCQSQCAPSLESVFIHAHTGKDALVDVGKQMVRLGLVDSFFGNISWRSENELTISQTAARLDELNHNLCTINLSSPSAIGLLASSELPAHRLVTNLPHARFLLHGHPRVPVALSLAVDPREESVVGIPVADGDGGVGGLADALYHVFKNTQHRSCIIRGHGIFCISSESAYDALTTMYSADALCKQHLKIRIEHMA